MQLVNEMANDDDGRCDGVGVFANRYDDLHVGGSLFCAAHLHHFIDGLG